jgi:hypothetical protein
VSGQGAQRLLAILGNIDQMPSLAEDELQEILCNGTVFGDEDSLRRYGNDSLAVILSWYHGQFFRNF